VKAVHVRCAQDEARVKAWQPRYHITPHECSGSNKTSQSDCEEKRDPDMDADPHKTKIWSLT